MGLIGTSRYFIEKRDIIADARIQGEQSGKLMAELAAPYLLRSDLSGLQTMAEHFIHTPAVQEVTIIDREGRELIHIAKPVLEKKTNRHWVAADPLGRRETRRGPIAVYPAEPGRQDQRRYPGNALRTSLYLYVSGGDPVLFSVLAPSPSRPENSAARSKRSWTERTLPFVWECRDVMRSENWPTV